MATPTKRKIIGIPKTKQRDNYDAYLVHESRVDVHSFSIYVGGDPLLSYSPTSESGVEPGVEHLMADRFRINLNRLIHINHEHPIVVYMSSCGGNWDEGMQMFNSILTCPNPITVLASKWARSMTSLIPLAADRFLLEPHTKYMIHRGTYGFSGTDHEAETDNEEREKLRAMMYRIYSTRLNEQGIHKGKSHEEIDYIIDELMKNKVDVWFDGREAVRWGFADGIYKGDIDHLRAKSKNLLRKKNMLRLMDARIIVPRSVVTFEYPDE
ncbi:ATP-dependent Clp protease proteolytic subunit [Candidatus Kaiserbacteria bacterium]|nr:ATP-dependent Clp protease proteolytic subunit [Candidatus Kaiserbacteria bacterium]